MPHSANAPQDTGLVCLVMLARYFGVAAEAGQLQHQFGQAGTLFGATEILRASKLLGLKARQISSDITRLDRVQWPAMARHKDG
ncbi:MAG: cysteine peptidase family C39 domain-containing protein, partial [Pseudomonadota bacterium]|nr:cysteine peptidase family C39 domain-containing protein [Pseudomonadota bacterium]